MEHEVKVFKDERFCARPWGIFCSCGFKGCAADQREAERIKVSHERWMRESEKLEAEQAYKRVGL